MSRTTTALVVSKLKGPFELREIELSTLQPDEVLVEIHASGICHTDLSCADGTLPCSTPAVLGHEGAGIVLEAGSEVQSVSKGDKVLLSFSHCENCAQCKSGHPAYCHTFTDRNFGGKRPDGSASLLEKEGRKRMHSSFFGQSSFGRHALVHRSSVVKVGPETDLALYAPLGCGMQTGAGAVLNTLNVKPGGSVAVFGVGGVGMAAVMAAAKIRGAKMVIAIDLQKDRLELAKELGATHGILGSDPDVVQQIQKLCPPNGVEFAVDCTGVPKVVKMMVDSLGTRGKAVTVGAPGPGPTVDVDIMTHLILGREYVGCTEGDSVPSRFIPYLIEQHTKGSFPLERLVKFYNVADHAQAFEDSKTGKVIKAVLKWT